MITGGAGYIGSHVAVELMTAGYDVVIVDDLRNSHRSVIDRIESITQRSVQFFQIDICDRRALEDVFSRNSIDAVIHCAGLKAVGESTHIPLEYYRNNIDSTLSLLETMDIYGVHNLVFSSSATVYGSEGKSPYSETAQTGQHITSPYGYTKFMIEQILNDCATADPSHTYIALRYFNPVGAHSSGLIGEDPHGTPNNLLPFVAQVASGEREQLTIWGNDYDTPDGTCIRDYIHVVDLAKAHLAALDARKPGFDAINVGSGVGISVLEMLRAFERASGKHIPFTIGDRRPGDLPAYFADVSKAKQVLHWETTHTVDDICKDAWNWQSQHHKKP